jgi:NadR type nicotinamide-nucleotide adenylyltransferase
MLKRIVILGPESTGKSTLSSQLAVHYSCKWCPEFARKYLEDHGTNYTFDDLLTIAKGQWQLEQDYSLEAGGLLFIDTDQYVMKVWCEFVFNQCHNWILNRVADQKADLYLLTNIDLPWIKDDLREYPDEGPRKKLYHMYRDILVHQAVPWVEINGNYNNRLSSAISAVETILPSVK